MTLFFPSHSGHLTAVLLYSLPAMWGQWLVVEYLPSMPNTLATKKVGLGGGQCWHTPLILAIGKQRQTDLCLRAARATQKKTCLRKLRDGGILAVKNK